MEEPVVVEAKVVDFKIVDGKFMISVDPNKNGKALLEIMLELSEVPSEVVAIFKKD